MVIIIVRRQPSICVNLKLSGFAGGFSAPLEHLASIRFPLRVDNLNEWTPGSGWLACWLAWIWIPTFSWDPVSSGICAFLSLPFSCACCSHVSFVLYVKCTEHGGAEVRGGEGEGGQSLPATHLKFSQNCFLSLALFGFGWLFCVFEEIYC